MNTGLPSLPREVQALRTMLDARLNALESALADPSQHGSLQQLILDLARVATEEADAAARQACLEAERQGQGLAASVRAEARAALQAEQAAAVSLRQGLQQAMTALEAEKSAGATRESQLAELRKAVEQARAELQAERSGTAGRERDLKQALQALGAEQTARAAERQQLDELQAELKTQRAAAARERELASAQQALEQELQSEQAAHAAVRDQLQALKAAGETERASVAQMRDAVKRLKGDLETALREVATARREAAAARLDADGVRSELEAARSDVEVSSKTSSQSQSELEKSLKDAQRTVRETQLALKAAEARAADAEARAADAEKKVADAEKRGADAEKRGADAEKRVADAKIKVAAAESRITEAVAAREALQAQLDAVLQAPQSSGEGEGIDRDRYEQLLAANEKQIRSLELAARDADARTEAAERELRSMRRPPEGAAGAPGDASPRAAAPVAAASAEDAAHSGPARAAKRVAMPEQIDIQIDGIAAKLIDLSITGAQILAPAALKPNRIMKLTIPHKNKVITCKGKIMWSKLETAIKTGGQLWYRGGLQFTASDQAAIEAFISSHSS